MTLVLDELRERVWRANMGLVEAGLIVLTWGNASGVDRKSGVMAIKPSGVPYDELRPEHVVIVDLETGGVRGGTHRPSSDTPTHLEIYRAFEGVGGVVHTHSTHATSFAQARRPIPCLGTTHADSFYGEIPVTRGLSEAEIRDRYEQNTGHVIVECFRTQSIDPLQVPGVLVPGHGPFAWGQSPEKALENAIVLEAVSRMAFESFLLNGDLKSIPRALLDKHFLRKHGADAYYGQAGR
jgi:L-ribulose-5-phosphate 4-epimerase